MPDLDLDAIERACDKGDKLGRAKATLDNLNMYYSYVQEKSPEMFRWLRALVARIRELEKESTR